MKLRLLFADDQIPYTREFEAENEAVKREIIAQKGEQLRKKWPDPELAVEEDRLWFEALLRLLQLDFDVTPVRRFADAQRAVLETEKFDLAVIDLSWTGDADRRTRERENIGFELLETLADQGKTRGRRRPVIALSQNFADHPELVKRALERGALPVPKNYTVTPEGKYPGHEALSAALQYLAQFHVSGPRQFPQSEEKTGRTVPDLVHALLSRIGGLAAVVILILALAVLVLVAHSNTRAGETVKVFGVPLYTRGF